MPQIEFMCVSCGHTFKVSVSNEELEDLDEVECPSCGSTDTNRTYDEDTDLGEDELIDDVDTDDDEELGDFQLDDE